MNNEQLVVTFDILDFFFFFLIESDSDVTETLTEEDRDTQTTWAVKAFQGT